MKIALVCPASLPATQFGGILFLSLDLARELSKKGHRLRIFTTDMDFANNPKTFNKKLPRIEQVEKFEIFRSHVWASLNLFFINPGIFFQMLKDDSEIIHSIGVRSFQSFMAALIAKKKNIPLIISDQGGLTTHPDLKNNKFLIKLLYKIQKPMLNFVIKTSSKIIVANYYEEKIFSEFKAGNKLVIVKNGINFENLLQQKNYFRKKYSIEKPFILFLGRFNKVKGIDILIEAIGLIKKQLEHQIEVIIMGVDFGFQDEMLRIIDKNDLRDIIRVIKNPSREDVIGSYGECEFLVLPSRWELSPLTPLEAFVFKKTVISTNTHGIPHTIQNRKNCILVQPENSLELSRAIITLVENEELRKNLGQCGYDLVQNTCNSKQMAANTMNIYQQVLDQYNNK